MLEYKRWLLYFCSLRTAILLRSYCKGQIRKPITIINLFANSQRLWDHRRNLLLLSVAVTKSLEQCAELGQIKGTSISQPGAGDILQLHLEITEMLSQLALHVVYTKQENISSKVLSVWQHQIPAKFSNISTDDSKARLLLKNSLGDEMCASQKLLTANFYGCCFSSCIKKYFVGVLMSGTSEEKNLYSLDRQWDSNGAL